jgi:hypothetical protein
LSTLIWSLTQQCSICNLTNPQGHLRLPLSLSTHQLRGHLPCQD